MGRLTNEKCWACSLITATEARKLHDDPNNGDLCWRSELVIVAARIIAKAEDEWRGEIQRLSTVTYLFQISLTLSYTLT